jgi:hypothetical protein
MMSAVARARCNGLQQMALIPRPLSNGAAACASASPAMLSGTSRRPWHLPVRFQSVWPWRKNQKGCLVSIDIPKLRSARPFLSS